MDTKSTPANTLHAASSGPDWPFWQPKSSKLLEKKLAASAVREVTKTQEGLALIVQSTANIL